MSSSKDVDTQHTEVKRFDSYENDVYNNNLSRNLDSRSSMDKKTSLIFTFKSGRNSHTKEFQSTGYQFNKITFLMTSMKLKSNLKQELQLIKTEVTLGTTTSYVTVKFVSEHHEHDFADWVESCLHLTELCVRDLELLLLKRTTSELYKIEKAAERAKLPGDYSMSVFQKKDIDGVFLLGSVDCLVYLMLDLQSQFNDISFLKPETKEEVKLSDLRMTATQCRLNSIFKGIDQMKTLFPYMTIFHENESVLTLFGNQNDISAGIRFFNSFSWVQKDQWKCCPLFEGFEFFFARENIQSFIDRMITTQGGTWIAQDEQFGNTLVAFGNTEGDVEAVIESLKQSVTKKEIIVTDVQAMTKIANDLKTKGEELEKIYDEKLVFHIDDVKSQGFLKVTFMFTADLEIEKPLKMLVQEIESQSNSKARLPKSKNQLTWLQRFYTGDLLEEAHRCRVTLNLLKDINAIELDGTVTAVRKMTEFINSICMEEQNIFLPIDALPAKVTNFLDECRCCFEYTKDENSKFWIRGKIGIVASCCQSEFDHMYSHVRAKLMEGEHRTQSESSVLVKCPILEVGDKGDVLLIDGGLKLLFQIVKKMKKMSVAFDIQDLSNKQTHIILKSILDQVFDLPDGLIIVLQFNEEAIFQNTVDYLQETDTYPTEGIEKGSQKKQIEVRVIQGKIAELPNEVDVIVNTSSPDLDITRGAVSMSILKAAGDGLKNEIARIPVIKQGSPRVRVEYGDVVETFGHRLKCKRIFHGTLCKWTDDKTKSQDVLRRFVKKCISLADERKFKTLAFPAIGTGHLQIPPDVVGSCVKKVVEEYSVSHPHTSVEEIIFVIYEKDIGILQKFKDILETNKDVVHEVVPPTLYRFSVFGEMHNIFGAMNLLTGLFREHIINSTNSKAFQNQKKTRAREEKEYKVNTNHRQENRQLEETQDKKTKNEEVNSHEDVSKVPTSSGLLEKTNQSAPDDYDERCLLLQSKNNMTLSGNTLGPILKDVACDVVSPFLKDCCALIIFKTTKDSDKFFPMLAKESLDVQKLPKQEVKNTKAKLGSKVINVLEKRKMSSPEFYRRTGGTLCIQTGTVTGNLLVLQHVQKFLKDLVEEFERPKTPETWTPNAEYYLTGVFHI